MRFKSPVAGWILALILLSAPSALADKAHPVVLELFTSQGCSSCPPADQVLGQFADKEDVVALSFHVDYWDYIGWKDTFASKQTTARQHRYAQAMAQRHVYTPQLVVGGQKHIVGSDLRAVQAAVSQARKSLVMSGNGSEYQPSVNVEGAGKGLKINVSSLPGIPCEAWLFAVDRRHEVAVRRGENSGQKLVYSNVVRAVKLLGTWDGGDREFAVSGDGMTVGKPDGYVIIVQAKGQGPVLAAAQHWLD